MQARRFWNLLKLLRIDGEEPDLEIQCQILQIKKQDLITFMRDEEKMSLKSGLTRSCGNINCRIAS